MISDGNNYFEQQQQPFFVHNVPKDRWLDDTECMVLEEFKNGNKRLGLIDKYGMIKLTFDLYPGRGWE